MILARTWRQGFPLLLALITMAGQAWGLIPERRRHFEERRPNEYLVIPAVASLPGIGVFVGVISSFSNVGDSGIDLAAAVARSVDNTDIDVQAVALREVPLLIPGLTFDYHYAHIELGNYQAYLPGRDSPDFTIPITAEFDVQVIRPALRLFERRFNLFYTLAYFKGFGFDENGNEYPFADHDAAGEVLLDLTDDEVDPHVGMRLRYGSSLHAPRSSLFGEDKGPDDIVGQNQKVTVESYELAFYLPVSQRVVLAWDNRYFQAQGMENSDEVISGGSPPLRGYPEGRWSDRFGVFSGLEVRYDYPYSRRLDFLLARGLLEGLQYALFYEVGQVSPTEGHLLYKDMHESYGAGVRALFDAIVLRLDIAQSDEGTQLYLTIGQPF